MTVFLLTIAAHLLVIGGAFWRETYPEGSSDEARYVFHAQTIRAGNGMHAAGREDQPTAYVMPLAPILFSLTTPHSLVGLRLTQLILCGGIAILTYHIGRKLGEGDRLVGWLAVIFLLGNLGWLLQPLFLLTEVLFVFWMAIITLLVLYFPSSWRALAGVGLTLGLAWLTRGALFGTLAILMLYLWWRAGFAKMVWVGAILLLSISPWIIRNYAAFGTFVATSTQSGNVLAGAYNDEIYQNPWGEGWINPDLLYGEEAMRKGIFDEEVSYANFQSQQAQAWMLANPQKLPKLWAAHVFGFIRPWFGIARNPLEWGYELASWGIGAAFLGYGAWVALNNRQEGIILLWLMILGGFLLSLAFYGIPRFRLPYAPMLAAIQAYAAWQLFLGRKAQLQQG